MSFDATGQPTANSADETIQAAGAFWPEITLAKFREAARVDHTMDDPRSAYQLRMAVAHINRQLAPFREDRELDGDTGLGTTEALYYQAAVHHHAKARLLEQYRDVDSRRVGTSTARDPQALDERINTEWREVRNSLSALRGRPLATVELI
ncbi:head completion/stabilization protein [Guyparkeria sp. GHLCS8-2]|uniref:head completion/stabilization protein n=1 Tax=Guyparkeria halopsychrophila TaxID=3139421 RepID=UPI0037C4F95E